MGNKIADSGLVIIFGSVLAMTLQKSFEFGYGIAAGIVVMWFGLRRETKK